MTISEKSHQEYQGDESRRKIGDPPENYGLDGASTAVKLQPLTEALLECVTPAEVVEAVVERGVAVLGARAGLVALLSDDGVHLEVVRTSGYSPEVMKGWERFPLAADLPLSDAVRGNEVLLFEGGSDWWARYPDMVRQIPQGNYLASASLPLSARGKVFGALHFSFPIERNFSAADQEFLADLSRQCALALDRAILLERAELSRSQAESARAQAEAARDAAQAANRRLEFLSRASALLGESLDYQTRLEGLARLCVPEVADWAGVDVLDEDGNLVRLAVAHRDPLREEAMREIQRRFPPQAQRGSTTLTVIQTGERLFYPDIPEHLIDQGAVDGEHARLLKAVGVKAALSLPLTARGKTLGALSLGTGPEPVGSGRSFPPEIISLAEELARRAAVLIDNARLFHSVEVSVEALRASEERYRTLFETAALGIVYQDADAAILDANPAAQRILGLSLDQMQGRTSMDPRWKAVKEDGSDFPGEEHPVPKALRSCEMERGVMGIFHPEEETYRWLDVTAVPQCRRPGDKPHLVYALFEDITERRRAEQEGREAEQRQRKLAREMLYSLTEGRMRLADSDDDLPTPLSPISDEVALSEGTLRVLRKQVEAVAEQFGIVKERRHDLLTAVGEASMNAVRHGRNGVSRVQADAERGVIQVWVTDQGGGIAADQIHRALERGWTTGGFGHGWWFILKAIDRVYLLTGPTGTTVVLEMDRDVFAPSWLEIVGPL